MQQFVFHEMKGVNSILSNKSAMKILDLVY